ncbi:dipeptidase PepV [Mycoplasmatota bacterium zrk1]
MNSKLNIYHNEMVEELQAVVQIKSVEDYSTASKGKPFGEGPYNVLDYVLNLCERLGMNTTNMDGYVGYAEVGEGEEMIALLTHLDVVPEGELDNWEFPPYSATIKDGMMFGRGVSDNKSPAIASIYALKSLMDSKTEFNKRVRLIFGANEESGFECMKHYVRHGEIPTIGFTPDAMFPIVHGEKGITQLLFKYDLKQLEHVELIDLVGGNAPNNVPDKCVLTVKPNTVTKLVDEVNQFLKDNEYSGKVTVSGDKVVVVIYGQSAHASTPEEGINSIAQMLRLMEECDMNFEFVRAYNKKIGLCYDGFLMNCNFKDEYGILTMNVGLVEVDSNRISFTIDVRYPISLTIEDILEPMKESLNSVGFDIETTINKDPIFYELDNPIIQSLVSAYREVTNDNVNQPMTMGGGTYARAMPNLVAFGGMFPNEQSNAHQPNEFISINRFFEQTEIYIKAIQNLLNL